MPSPRCRPSWALSGRHISSSGRVTLRWPTARSKLTPPSVHSLPANVVLREDDGQTLVEAMDPRAVMGLVENAEVETVAAEVEARLRRVIGSLVAPTPEGISLSTSGSGSWSGLR